jgi:hypothetical protein
MYMNNRHCLQVVGSVLQMRQVLVKYGLPGGLAQRAGWP